MDAGCMLGDHLRSPGLSAQFALMVDAHLVADGKLVPIHKSLLAAGSPVFADLFLSATNSNNSEGTDTFPMPEHTVADICAVPKFLYKRTATVATAHPAMVFGSHLRMPAPSYSLHTSATCRPMASFRSVTYACHRRQRQTVKLSLKTTKVQWHGLSWQRNVDSQDYWPMQSYSW